MTKCLKSAFAFALVLGFAAPAAAETVRDWRNGIHYPARVLAVQWPNGRLDASSSVRFGAWTIGFGTPPKFAVYFHGVTLWIVNDSPDPKAPRGYNTLRCSNAAVGEVYCGLHFDLGSGNCQLGIYGHMTRDNRYVDIPCPITLELAQ